MTNINVQFYQTKDSTAAFKEAITRLTPDGKLPVAYLKKEFGVTTLEEIRDGKAFLIDADEHGRSANPYTGKTTIKVTGKPKGPSPVPSRSSSDSSLLPRAAPHPHRLARWRKINAVVNKNRSKRPRIEAEGFSTGYSYTRWAEIHPIFDEDCVAYTQPCTPIPQEDFDTLSKILSWIIKCFHGSLIAHRDSEARCLQLIAPVLWSVAQLLPDVTVFIEQDLDGVRVDAYGHFEFVLIRGNKRICIVQAKEEKFKQGVAQALLGCEVAADLDGSDVVYGVVTNFIHWIFLKSANEQIFTDQFSAISITPDAVEDEGIRNVVGKLHSLLL